MFAARSHRRSKAFTLIELLVVISIIGVLIALLLPAVQKVREAANQAQCKNNLKQIGLGLTNYHVTNNAYPPGDWVNSASNPTVSHGWVVYVLPFIEEENLFKLYDFSKDWTTQSATVLGQQLKFMRCPSAPANLTANGAACGDYSAISDVDPRVYTQLQLPAPADSDGVLIRWSKPSNPPGVNLGKKVRTSDIRDGNSNTLMVVEASGRPEIWGVKGLLGSSGAEYGAAWADAANHITLHGVNSASVPPTFPGLCAANCINFDKSQAINQGKGDGEIFALHPSVFIAALADGSVRSINSQIQLVTAASLVTRRGGEIIRDDF